MGFRNLREGDKAAGDPTFIRHGILGGRVADASAFNDAAFLGLSRASKRDPYRLSLFAAHLLPAERARVLLAVHGGTLIITDRRILEFRAHLEVHGAWNVKEFQGYEVRRAWDCSAVRGVEHVVGPAQEGAPAVEDTLRLRLEGGSETVVVSRGPEPTLPQDDFDVLRAAVLDHPK